jgi:hypothetical protein
MKIPLKNIKKFLEMIKKIKKRKIKKKIKKK